MKTFKQFTEASQVANVSWLKDADKFIFKVSDGGAIPVSRTLVQILAGQPHFERMNVFHKTGINGALHIIKRIHSKQTNLSLSASIKPSRDWSVYPIGGEAHERYTPFLLVLESDVLAGGAEDIMSRPDMSGRRWVSLFDLENGVEGYAIEGLGRGIKQLAESFRLIRSDLLQVEFGKEGINFKEIARHDTDDEIWRSLKDSKYFSNLYKIDSDIVRRVKGRLVKAYIDALYDLFKNDDYSRKILRTLFEPKKAVQDYNYDEQIVSNFKVKAIGADISSLYEDNDQLVRIAKEVGDSIPFVFFAEDENERRRTVDETSDLKPERIERYADNMGIKLAIPRVVTYQDFVDKYKSK